jgi:uncharacterized membrane protein (DUF485 family)
MAEGTDQITGESGKAGRNSRFGLWLFFIYLTLYGGFVLLNAFRPEIMETTPVAGLNLAVLYGFGLILGALALSLIYGLFSVDSNSAPGGELPAREKHS